MTAGVLEVKQLKKHYEIKSMLKTLGTVKALDGVSFNLKEKETLAIVGESGCGKSTLAKTLMQIETRTSGDYKINDQAIDNIKAQDFRKWIQLIFQDPYGSINPRKKAWQIIAEPLFINSNKSKEECRELSRNWMEKVGLRKEYCDRYPHMFSGGQRQRIGIARALILNPKILICDEPVSALDVSIQAQVLNLLMDLQEELGLSYLFISHDLSVVQHIADRIMVMYLGKIVEIGTRDQIFNSPQHPYTKALLNSTPKIEEEQEFTVIEGELPSPLNPPLGCAFHKRCPLVSEECERTVPDLENKLDRKIACLKF